MKNNFLLIKGFMALVVTITSLNAMNFSVNRNYKNYNLIYAYGNIKYGDLNKLKRSFNKVDKNRQTIVVFNSNGGVLSEGLKIGRFLKQNRIGTSVRKNGICASSCAMSFLGGRSKSGKRLMILPTTSYLGFHSFYYKEGSYVKLTKVQKDMSSVLNYAAYVGAPNYLMGKMFNTSSKNMYFVNNQDRRALGISTGLRYKNSGKYVEIASSNYNKKRDAVSYLKSYFKKYNNLIASNSNSYKLSNEALNSYHYKKWLVNNVEYIYPKNIVQISNTKIKANVIYKLRSGARVCTNNLYTLSKDSSRWRITSKRLTPCSSKYRNLLNRVSKVLP